MTLKICYYCKKKKHLNAFYHNRANKSGYATRCKSCDGIIRIQSRTKARQRTQKLVKTAIKKTRESNKYLTSNWYKIGKFLHLI